MPDSALPKRSGDPDHSRRPHPSSLSSELRVFISSTFRDLQDEREHLVKKVFPEIRALCRERGVTFTEIDLRWGVTDEEARHGRVVRICLEEIDRCRPFFIGIVGSRYGWRPDRTLLELDPSLERKYPWIVEAFDRSLSVTEMEFVHGVFGRAESSYAWFYKRDEEGAGEDAPEEFTSLVERARTSGYPFAEFKDPVELGERVERDLRELIERHWPESEAPTPLELERRAHAAFARSRMRAYVPNPEYMERFTRWLAEGTTPLVVTGESGLGKSSLVAYMIDRYRREHPEAFIIEHYVGASHQSGSAASLVRHVVEEIRERFSISDQLPIDSAKIVSEFPNWLWKLGHRASESGTSVLIALDAINQLDEAGRRLSWLPPILPDNVKLLVTTTPGDTSATVQSRDWEAFEVTQIDDETIRESIIHHYLGEFHKEMPPERLRHITQDAKAGSPLYLRVVAEELRLHGMHETLDLVIARHVGAEDLEEVFQQVLERMEHDYGVDEVRGLLSSLWASRSGLSEPELMAITGLHRLDLSRLLFALDYHLVHKDGLLGFFHDYLRRAVEKRHLADDTKRSEVHISLADYFESHDPSLRTSRELAWQLRQADARSRLADLLSTIPHFMTLYQGSLRDEVLGHWAHLGEEFDIEDLYRSGLDRHAPENDHQELRVLANIAEVLRLTGRWNGSEALTRRRLVLATQVGNGFEEAGAHVELGHILHMYGEHASAFEELGLARVQFELLKDENGLSRVLGGMGRIHMDKGEFDKALQCFNEDEALCRAIGNQTGLAGAIINSASVYAARSDYGRALERYRQGEAICREIGDLEFLKNALGGIGIVYANSKEPERALQYYDEWERICRQLGDRYTLTHAIGSKGNLYSSLGEFDRAISCFDECIHISRELGNRFGEAIALTNMGQVHLNQHQFDRALECFQRALTEFRSMAARDALSHVLLGIAQVLMMLNERSEEMPPYLAEHVPNADITTWQTATLQQVSEHATECVAIAEEVANPQITHNGHVLLARIDAARGDTSGARAKLAAMLDDEPSDDERADILFWMWIIGDDDSRRAEALELYRRLAEKMSAHDYQSRIEQLEAGGEGGEAWGREGE